MGDIYDRVLGDGVPVRLLLNDGETGMFPQAVIIDNDGNVLDTLSLTHEANGVYKPATEYVMPNELFIYIVYIVYTNALHTIESTIRRRDVDIVNLLNPDDYKATGFAVPNEYNAALAAIYSEVENIDGAPMRGTDLVPTNPLLTNDARLNNLDAAISSRSSHTAESVWAVATRTLTSFGTLAADITTAVWSAGSRTLTGFGTLIVDIWGYATRSLTAPNDYKADVTGLATEVNATANKDEIVTEVNANEAKIDAVGLIVSDIQLQTDKIPAMIIDLIFLKDIEGGNWERDGVQMIFRTAADVEVARFNLFKFDGTPATETDDEVAKRERV